MKQHQYESKPLDSKGQISWTDDEHKVWTQLVARQLECIKGKACREYFDGLELLDLPKDRAPQIPYINRVLAETTGWQLEPVPALIDFDHFFALLASRRFPVATFLRTQKDFDYLKEPDFFHEIFGHCAMLTHPAFASFTQHYGKLGVNASKSDRVYLARLYWFTVEFGMIQNDDGISIYGGGILSSPSETEYAYGSVEPIRKKLDVVDVMRTPYRIDILQPIYFYLSTLDELYELEQLDLLECVNKAKTLGLHAPLYPQKIA
ncbi:phenylalanine 4-monooxygenase [Grimontia kaedaensis]|uniref:Phenylalanine-4-hydroxylase n=1 Tax=Grimontia kaedaensis TaxID=2872157 RepID=A0ABY4WZ38_9GAMM|nr:phenylalanine 4-monooxygenase [Grimontia kaedaensis]USH04252.1 phenylalanine 4-monooxygenase [Grimontia kaedaensis]